MKIFNALSKKFEKLNINFLYSLTIRFVYEAKYSRVD